MEYKKKQGKLNISNEKYNYIEGGGAQWAQITFEYTILKT